MSDTASCFSFLPNSHGLNSVRSWLGRGDLPEVFIWNWRTLYMKDKKKKYKYCL